MNSVIPKKSILKNSSQKSGQYIHNSPMPNTTYHSPTKVTFRALNAPYRQSTKTNRHRCFIILTSDTEAICQLFRRTNRSPPFKRIRLNGRKRIGNDRASSHI